MDRTAEEPARDHAGTRPDAAATCSGYVRHEPEKSVLYQVVSQNLETFLEEVCVSYEKPLPGYVEKELRDYLRCGILAAGFVRLFCDRCQRSIVLAFSCKRRGACPSCNARRMCNSAAFLVDHVVPDVPVRQWVLSVPFELRLLLAKRTDALNCVGRVFVREVFRWQRERARDLDLCDVQSGAIEWPQRFGGSLDLNVHYHLAVPDGVFTRRDPRDRARFHRLPRPGQNDLDDLACRVSLRVERWLRRKRLLCDGEQRLFNNEMRELEPLDACLQGSLGIGELTYLRDATVPAAGDELAGLSVPSKSDRRGGHYRGFDVHAGVVVSGSDREGRERLFRYCARPPLSLERLSVTEEGLVAYRFAQTVRAGADSPAHDSDGVHAATRRFGAATPLSAHQVPRSIWAAFELALIGCAGQERVRTLAPRAPACGRTRIHDFWDPRASAR
jgi:hypothetical protein